MAEPMGERIAVLVSGSGTNLQALLDDPVCGPRIALVLSDRHGVEALDRAETRGVEWSVLEPKDFEGREAFDRAVADVLRDRGIDVVVTAGYLRLLGPAVLEAYEGRWLNVHPSLLPAFPGMRGVADALAYRVKVTGVTVFLVDAGMDTGAVVLQEAIEVRDDDDRDSLEARVHEVEHRLLPAATAALVEGRLRVDGRTVTIEGGPG
ncbi:MAG TPA: phosphoribosylglycinamide formyltransferase [Actinomycetota bacterium]|nr:phosphoribosylglycinamide formyltransferase [Actinomycetota bacterium]